MPLTGLRRQLALMLFEVEAIKFGAFKMKLHEKNPDAPLSPIYLMLRGKDHPKNPGPVTQDIMDLIGDLFMELDLSPFDCYADIPNAGPPFGDQMARALADTGGQQPRLQLTKVIREDGSRYIAPEVEGDFTAGEVCLLVDDMVTGADTKLEAIEVLESAGLRVYQVVVTVDREQGADGQLGDRGYQLVALLKLSDMLDLYVEEGLLDEAKANEVREYIAANQVA